MQKKNCYSELPAGYLLVKEIDAVEDKKFALKLNVLGGLLMLVAGITLWALRYAAKGERFMDSLILPLPFSSFWQTELFLIAIIVAIAVYMLLHELTHGIVYHFMTHEKLRFGVSLSCAYCGVPQVFVTRRTALCALLAPFLLFTLIFLPPVFLADSWVAAMALLLFAAHFGGCVGDLYDAWLLLTSLRGDLLMNDTGPKQSFYMR